MNDWRAFGLWKSFMEPNRIRRCQKKKKKILAFALTTSLAAVSKHPSIAHRKHVLLAEMFWMPAGQIDNSDKSCHHKSKNIFRL